MKAINVVNPGKDSRLEIREIPTPKPGDLEILVKIEATALNRADLLQRRGNYPSPEGTSSILGLEMAGVVEQTGSAVTRWKPGDVVFSLLPGGGYAEYCTVHERMAMRVPENLTFTEAAAIPETFLTAYQALVWIGKLESDETVLIHAGGSGVGTAAIQLSRHLVNARIVTTAGKARKLDACRTLGADLAFNYRDVDFSEAIQEELGPDPINLVIDFVGTSYWEKNMSVLAVDGRLVVLSLLGGHKIENTSLVPILRKRLSIIGSTLRSRTEAYKIELSEEFSSKTMDFFKKESIAPVIDSEFDWEAAEEAHQRMADNKNTGKIVLTGM